MKHDQTFRIVSGYTIPYQQLEHLDAEIEALKFEQIQEDLRSVGLPAGEQVWHSAMVLSYAEAP